MLQRRGGCNSKNDNDRSLQQSKSTRHGEVQNTNRNDVGSNAPIFVARNLHKLPPVGFELIDVSYFLHRMEEMEANLSCLKQVFSRYMKNKNDEVEKIVADIPPEFTANNNATASQGGTKVAKKQSNASRGRKKRH